MPAGITQTDSMVSTEGIVPWHELKECVVIDDPYLRSPDVNKAAGLTWKAIRAETYTRNILQEDMSAGMQFVQCPRTWAIVRSDNGEVLATCGDRYEIFQNDDAPKFLDNLVDSGDGHYKTAGSLHGGRKTWWLMERPEHVYIGGDKREEMASYLFLSNSFDSSTPLILGATMIRIVCQNTLSAAIHGAKQSHRIRHTPSMHDRWQEARNALNLSFKYEGAVLEVAEQLVNAKFGEAEITQTLDALVPLKDADGDKKTGHALTYAENTRDGILGMLNSSYVGDWTNDNAWGFLQAVSAYHDHSDDAIRRTTKTSSAEENRFKSMFGLTAGENLTSQCFNLLTMNKKLKVTV